MLLGPYGSSPSPVSLSAKPATVDGEIYFVVTGNGIEVHGNQVKTEEYVVHFSAPLKTWWTDVRFACGKIHVFGSQSQATEWVGTVYFFNVSEHFTNINFKCERYGFKYGEVMNLDIMWKLS